MIGHIQNHKNLAQRRISRRLRVLRQALREEGANRPSDLAWLPVFWVMFSGTLALGRLERALRKAPPLRNPDGEKG